MEFFKAVNNSGLNVSTLNVQDLKMDRGSLWWAMGGDTVTESCVEFFKALNNSGMKVLKLNVQDLTDQTAEHFAVGLAESQSVQALRVQHCNISSAGAVSIFRSLEHNTSLEEVDLSENSQLTEGDSEAVGCAIERVLNVNRTLKVLNLRDCKIADPIAKHITTGLTNNKGLVKLNIGLCTLSGKCAMCLFQQVITHSTLTIVGEIGVLGVGRVEMYRGTMLCITSNTVPENCIEFFKALNKSGIKVFRITVQDKIAEHLAVELAEGLSIQTLKANNISSAGAVSIFRSLKYNTSLEELDLSGNSQLAEGDSEAVGCAIERMLNVNTTLKVLNLSGCNVTVPIVKCIVTGLTKNTSLLRLYMGSPKLSGSCTVSLFQQMTIHPTLSITVGEVNILGVGRVKMDRGSLWWAMGGDTVTESCVEFFKALNNSGMKVLKLNVQDLTDQTAEHFAVGLAESQSVQALRVQHCNISSAGAVSIFRSLEHNTSLEELDLSGNSQLAEGDSEAVGCAIERMLNVNTTLKVLNLGGCNVTDPIVQHILTGLTKNTSLVTLDMSSPKLSGSCAVSLFQQMTTHPTLSITVGEVNVLGVGKIKMDKGTLWCVTGDTISENCVEFFIALNNSGLKASKLIVEDFTDHTAEHFAVGLAQSQSVQALKLECCNISSAGAVNIFRSLEHNTSLEEVDLSENSQLTEGDSEAVGCAIERVLNVNRTLKVLNLRDCKIADPIAKHITTGLTNNKGLVKLNIGLCTLSGKCAMCLFQQVITHSTLSIVGEIGVLGVGRVEMYRGTMLCITSNTVPENCIEFFKALNKSGIKVFRITVQDKIAEHLAVELAKGLSIQTLKANNISSAGAVSIFRSLKYNTSLEELDLSGNSQLAEGDSEAVGCAIERMLNVNTTLKVLNLSGCNVTVPIVKCIVTGLTKNTSLLRLYMGLPKLSGSCTVSLFQQMTIHPTLSITVGEVNILGVGRVKMDRGSLWWAMGGDTVTESCVEFFKALNNSGMKVLKLNVQDLTDHTAEHIAVGLVESQSVRALKLEHCNISSAGSVNIFRSLEHNTSLEELDLSGNSQLAEGDSEAVACAIERMLNVNGTLKVLNLSGCQVTDSIAKHIITGLTKNISLVNLNIGSCKLNVSDAVSLLQQVTTCPTLSRVSVGEMHVLDVGRLTLDRRTATVSLLYNTGDKIPENCSKFIKGMNHSGMVSKLNARNLTDQRAEHSVELAEKLSVQVLDLKHNTIGSTGAVSIFRLVEHNTSLDKLDLSWNWQLVKDDSEAVGCAIERMLNMNKTLKVLNLGGCGLDTAVVTHIAAGLAQNASLTELNIADIIVRAPRNNITSEGWVHVFKALHSSTSLKKLDISHNNLGMEGSVALAEMLSCNKSLTELNLRGCDIPEDGLREIAKALLCNISLKKLNISHISQLLGMEGSLAAAEMLSCNKSLTELNLRGCDIPEAGLTEIARGLLQNTTLQTLKFLNPHYKTFLEAEIERLKRSEIISPET